VPDRPTRGKIGEVGASSRAVAASRVTLRAVSRSDVAAFYRHLHEPGARWMAAFGARGEPTLAAWQQRWANQMRQPTSRFRTVLVDRHVAGYVVRFTQFEKPAVAYWYGRRFWGRGVATLALREFLRADRTRPVYARVAHDNPGSRRVLEKCGFVVVGRARSFAAARNRRLTELILRLGPEADDPRPRRSRPKVPARRRRSGSRAA
jgi:RimJ/RimL family protein N-acetyltransferase